MPSEVIVHARENREAMLPFVAGCPVDGNSVRLEDSVTLNWPDGQVETVQAVPLNRPNADGVLWVEVSGIGTSTGTATLAIGPRDAPANASIATESDAGVVLDNALIQVTLNRASTAAPIEMVAGDAYGGGQGALAPEVVITGDSKPHRDGEDERQVKLLRNGPLRAQAELTGRLLGDAGGPSMGYRLTVTVWKGIPAAQVDWMLIHDLPGQAELPIERASLVGEWQLGGSPTHVFHQCHHTNAYKPRDVHNPETVALVTDFSCVPVHIEDPAMLLDDAEYARFLPTPTTHCQDWLALLGEQGAVLGIVRDMANTRPNRLLAEANRLTYDMIPMGHTTQWPQGRRREQTLFLSFADAKGFEPRTAAADARALDYHGRAQVSPQTLRDLKLFDMDTILAYEPGRNVRFTALFNGLCRLDTPGNKWDLGDTADLHYTRMYAGIPNRYELKPGAPDMQPNWMPDGRIYPMPLTHFVEPVWTNNEYDIIHALAQQVSRTGLAAHMQTLQWFARHNIEVDFLVYNDDKMHDRATPAHSAHHNTTGAYPSHFWTQGLLQYYLLTGDRDALDVAVALGDKTIECLNDDDVCPLKFDREAGWGLLVLVCLVEATREQRFFDEAKRLADFFIGYDREAHDGMVNLSAGDGTKCLDRQIVDCAFGYMSLIEALDRYLKLANDANGNAWFVDFLRSLKTQVWAQVDEGKVDARGLVMHMMAIGYERTGDEDFLTVCNVGLDMAFGPYGKEPSGEGQTKPAAIVYRSLQRVLGHADRAGLLAQYDYPSLQLRRRRNSGTSRVERP